MPWGWAVLRCQAGRRLLRRQPGQGAQGLRRVGNAAGRLPSDAVSAVLALQPDPQSLRGVLGARMGQAAQFLNQALTQRPRWATVQGTMCLRETGQQGPFVGVGVAPGTAHQQRLGIQLGMQRQTLVNGHGSQEIEDAFIFDPHQP